MIPFLHEPARPDPDLSDLPVQDERPHPYTLPTAAPFEVPTICITPTYDGSGSVTHPSVVDMVAVTGKPFRGWRYWCGITPYYAYDDTLENPSVLVSNNGFHWHVPHGLINPLDDPKWSPEPAGKFNSDTHLVWDPDREKFWLYWRRSHEMVHAASSRDGIQWDMHFCVVGWIRTAGASQLASQVIERVDRDHWVMWGGEYGTRDDTNGTTYWTAPHPLGPWAKQGQTTWTGGLADNRWHFDMKWDTDAQAWFSMANISKVVSSSSRNPIFAAVSRDGMHWTATTDPVIDDGHCYRPSIFRDPDAPDFYNVWYPNREPGRGIGYQWWIKHTRIPRTVWTDLL